MNIRLGLVSAYSLLYGVHRHDTLLDKCVSLGVNTVSICDIDNLYGIHSFLESAKERNIRPIIGCALTIPNYLYCFVQTRQGFSRLCEILTIRNMDKDNDYKNFDPIPYLQKDSEGLVLASEDENVLNYLKDKVKHLFASITPTNIKAVSISRKLNIPLAFIDNSIFINKDDFSVHRVLCAIRLLKTIGNLKDDDTANKECVIRSSEEINKKLSSWQDAIYGTQQIAKLCAYNDLFNGWIFPNYKINTNQIDPVIELKRRVYEGNANRYGELADREIGRIEYELSIINEKGFAPYFLVIDDIVKMASRTCGRGSGAASIVSYGLNITNVDPLRHNLYFERFLNPSRPDPPDLDIDFAWDERDDLIKAVIEKFGKDKCARVANHNFFRYRSALRETAKVYGFTDSDITKLERQLQLNAKEENEIKIIKNDDIWKEIFAIAEKIEGLPRGLGMHCGGIVITPGPVCRYSPIEKSAMGYPLLAWEKEGCEAAGFVKIDLLGNRSLAVIRDTVINISEELGVRSQELRNRLERAIDDPDTISALAKGDSMGVFYIESPAMRQLQRKTNKGDFEHIVIHSSIIRPAANKFINEYIRRLKGGKWQALHPRLENILKESYGILCYQEDVSKTAVALAGFNEADADVLRKIIAKKSGGVKLAFFKKRFFEGCLKNNVKEETVQAIWEMMLSFDGYSFCKPHSASYAMVSFQSAYLRVHYPAEFMAAVLSNRGGFYRPCAYISEARRMKLITEGPDVNISDWKYRGVSSEKGAGNREQGVVNREQLGINVNRGILVIGFMAIKGLSFSGAQAIIEERERGGQFLSLDDFSRRVRLNRDDIVALTPAGVFDSIANGVPRQLQARILLGMNNEERKNKNELELFESKNIIKNNLLKKTAHLKNTELQNEFQSLGFLRNLHPLALWKDAILSVKNRVKAIHIGDYINQNIKMIGWSVTQKDVWTKDGLTMSFLSLEDETAMYETVIFPQVYDKYYNLLFDQRPLLVFGKVVNDNGAISLEVSRIETLCK